MKTYSAGEVVEATGASHATLQRYLKQNLTPFQACDVLPRGSGEKRQYSIRRVLQTAFTIECSSLGIAPARGAKAAFEFTDRGNPGRAVGELFSLGRTILVGLPRGENKVINVPPDQSLSDVLSTDSAAFIIDCGNVVAKVKSKLQ